MTTILNIDEQIHDAINCNDLNTLKTLVTPQNCNKIINIDYGYNALYYAIWSSNENDDIISYLMSIGTPLETNMMNVQMSAIELAMKNKKRIVFDYINQEKDNKIKKLEKLTTYLQQKINTSNDTIKQLSEEINRKNIDIDTIKRDNVLFLLETIDKYNEIIERIHSSYNSHKEKLI